MSCYVIAYDLLGRSQGDNRIEGEIKKYPGHYHVQRSVWLISTTDSAVSIRNNLKNCLDLNDKLFVGKLSGESAWRGLDTDWLRKHL